MSKYDQDNEAKAPLPASAPQVILRAADPFLRTELPELISGVKSLISKTVAELEAALGLPNYSTLKDEPTVRALIANGKLSEAREALGAIVGYYTTYDPCAIDMPSWVHDAHDNLCKAERGLAGNSATAAAEL